MARQAHASAVTDELADPHGNVTRIQRAADGLPEAIAEPGNIVTRLVYDHQRRLTELTDSRNLKTGYVHDEFGRLLRAGSVRQGDKDSLWRSGPWAVFSQRWLAYRNGSMEKGPGLEEKMAVNCLSGARGAIEYEHTDPVSETPAIFTRTLFEIEREQRPSSRIDVTNARTGLDTNILEFACGCQHKLIWRTSGMNLLSRRKISS